MTRVTEIALFTDDVEGVSRFYMDLTGARLSLRSIGMLSRP